MLAVMLAGVARPQPHLVLGTPNTMSSANFAASTAEVLPDGSVVLRDNIIDPEVSGGLILTTTSAKPI